jgi:LmbE family N-acetylglucosaminyl deacetylase
MIGVPSGRRSREPSQRPEVPRRPRAVTGRRQLLLLALTAPWAVTACSGDTGGAGSGGSTTPGGASSASGPTGSPGAPRPGGSSPVTTVAGPQTPSAWRTTGSRGNPTGGRVLNIVAHPDDDLLFLSPDLIDSIRSGAQVRTVFLTAGDAGRGPAYWQGRIRGIRAAYARTAGVGDLWKDLDPGLSGATGLSLAGAAHVSLVFLKLPDGGTGTGFRRYGHASLPRLWRGEQSTIAAVDGSATYSRGRLLTALTGLMTAFAPDVIRTQDFLGRFGDGDHNDHHATAYLTRTASRAYSGSHRLVSYQDYATSRRTANVSGELLAAKQVAFATYSRDDVEVFTRGAPAAGYKPGFSDWLRRQYVLAVE